MTWNYRILLNDGPAGSWWRLIEVFYDDDRSILAYSGADPLGETPEELRGDLEMMLLAFDRPVLLPVDLPGS